MRYVFIINPVSGKGESLRKIKPKIEEYFSSKDSDYSVYITNYKREGVEIARREAQKGDKIRVFACGGDGTMFDVVNGIAGFDNVEFGVIPGGSGNDFLRSFGTAEDFLDIESQLFSESFPIDLIKVGDWYSVNVCSMGMDAEICLAKDKFLKWKFVNGETAYLIACFYCLLSKTRNHFKITYDGKDTVEGDFLFAIGANAGFYGGGFHAAPNAVPNDALLDCITVNTVSRFKFVKLLGVYRRGEHLSLPICSVRRAKKMTVESSIEATVNMDGEIITAKKIDFEIVPSAARFIVPRTLTETVKNLQKSGKDKEFVNKL